MMKKKNKTNNKLDGLDKIQDGAPAHFVSALLSIRIGQQAAIA